MQSRLTPAVLVLCACGGPMTMPPAPTLEERVSAWLGQMTLGQKVNQMHGTSLLTVNDLFETPADTKLGIPGFKMIDGPRGVRAGTATTFPVGMARGATWDPALEQRIGEAMGLELAAKGGNVLLAPTVNILRHPAWGRAQETYGEDTVLLGAMGTAFIQGAQQHVLASLKHFAVYSIEDKRFDVDVTIDERTLREQYLPHFQKAVHDAHPGSVMSAYNSVNGHWCSENPHLLRDILDGEWAYDGFVESDWVLGTRSTAPAANAGLDIEMPMAQYYGGPLIDAVNDGGVPMAAIDDAVRRILRKKLEFGLDQPLFVDAGVIESDAHRQLTRDAEREAIVLLKNMNAALPLSPDAGTLVVVGALAATVNLGDHGSSNSVPSSAVTPLQGLMERATVTYVAGPTLSTSDQATISGAGAAVVVAGLTWNDEGEYQGDGMPGGDRHDLSLRISPDQEMLIEAVAALNPRTIVVLEGGSAIVVRPWVDAVQGLVMAWYPGEEGGHAIADVLFGDVAPSGKLPLTIPQAATDLPPFVNDANTVTYGFLHGYRYVDAMNETPEFPFGFGLSYAAFAYSNLTLSGRSGTFDVKNTGAMAADEVAQIYVASHGTAVMRAPRNLAGFQRVHLDPGATKTVTFTIGDEALRYWDIASSSWKIEPATYDVEVGGSSRDLPLMTNFSVMP
jgi:beta-glucosidase